MEKHYMPIELFKRKLFHINLYLHDRDITDLEHNVISFKEYYTMAKEHDNTPHCLFILIWSIYNTNKFYKSVSRNCERLKCTEDEFLNIYDSEIKRIKNSTIEDIETLKGLPKIVMEYNLLYQYQLVKLNLLQYENGLHRDDPEVIKLVEYEKQCIEYLFETIPFRTLFKHCCRK